MQQAAIRLAHAFKSHSEELQAWLDLIHLNAKTTMAMMFQNPTVPDPRQAAKEAAATLLDNARQLSHEAGINDEQKERFVSTHQRAIDDFNRALDVALSRGAKDRPSQALLAAQILRLPVGRLENVDEETWFDQLDEMDEAARRRSERKPEPALPNGTGRDEIAEWVARKHLTVDSSVREIWYSKQAPANEIRFLEVSDRLSRPEGKIEPLDFGLDIEGVSFRLIVADITSEQLQSIKDKKPVLPNGWSMDGATVWERRR